MSHPANRFRYKQHPNRLNNYSTFHTLQITQNSLHMAKRTRSNSPDWTNMFQELSDSFSGEIAGLIILVAGVVALFTLRGDDPWLVTVLGWGAFPFAVTLIVLGTVLILRRYAGYWSAEALVGAEVVHVGRDNLQIA